MFKSLVLASFLGLAMLGMQGCFWSGPSGPYASGPYASTHTVCDTNGNNCLACDDNNNCQRNDAQYASSRRTVCDSQGYNCLNCDSNNNNCESSSTARSYWGFIF
jgi:hypothetical protein